MALAVGTKLGPYEILAPLGAGGMGEVYRAKDTKLKREVALKVLPEAFAEDPERMARFHREAEVLAALNHPNIAQIYGVEQQALVMELVEGESPRGPMAFDEAWKIASQMAAGLEYAHEKGIVHRDLKPANVKITPDGVVKLLDFGLAKAFTGQAAISGNPENSPTLTLGATQLGVILGTAAYMAPEQAKGKMVDKRADIWSWGVVLYELLTGARMFQGEEAADTLAAVIHKEPDLAAVPEQTRKLLRRCLEKDPKRRLRDIGEAQYLIEDTRPSEPGARAQSGRPWAWWIITAALLAFAAGVSFLHFREAPDDPMIVKFQVLPPEKAAFGVFRLSPDGRYLAFTATEPGRRRLWVRALDSLESRVFPAADFANFPFWSPDSKSIGFASSDGKLKKIPVSGGPPQTICDASSTTRGTWSRDNVIVFAQGPGTPLRRVSATGGVPVPLTKLQPGENHYTPEFLPGGRRFLYLITGGKPENNGIHVGSLDNEPDVRLLPDESNATFASTAASAGSGYLLFHRENTLLAQPFNPASLRLTGDVFPLSDQIGTAGSVIENYSASVNGILAYGTDSSGPRQQLVWMDRSGRELGPVGPLAEYLDIRLSPDDKRIAFDRLESSNRDVWVLDLVRGVASRVTYDPETDNLPIWSPDGLQVLFPSRRSGKFDLYVKAATGAGEEQLLVKMGTPRGWATDWSRDGRFVLYEIPGQKTGQDLWIAPQFGERKPYPYLQTQFNEGDGVFSPDGHWIAYVSDESGRNEIYLQTFPLSKEKKRISTDGGTEPLWRRDGGELFYTAVDRTLISVPVKMAGTTVELGEPKPLFPAPAVGFRRRSYAVSGDGRRFLMSRPMSDSSATPITLVLNWYAQQKK